MLKQTKLNSNLLDRARTLRKEMTPEERKLWYLFLKDYPVRWYRQRIMGNFILDFYCAKAHLAVEVDGSQHYSEEGLSHDEERSRELLKYRIKVLRYSNADINKRFETVCQDIHKHIEMITPQSPAVTAPLEKGEPRVSARHRYATDK